MQEENKDAQKENLEQPKQTPETPSFDGQAFYSEGYKNAFNLVDNALNELGFEKPEGVKTTDFLRSALKRKEETKAPEPVQEKTVDLSEYEKKFSEFEATNKALNEKLLGMQSKAYESELQKAIPDNLILPVGLDAEGKEAYSTAIKSQISAQLKGIFKASEGGKIIAVSTEGIPLINPKTAAPYTPTEYVKEKFKTFYAKETKAPEVHIKEIKTEGINLTLDAIPTSKREVTSLLIKNGITVNSPKHQKAYTEIIEKYKITEL